MGQEATVSVQPRAGAGSSLNPGGDPYRRALAEPGPGEPVLPCLSSPLHLPGCLPLVEPRGRRDPINVLRAGHPLGAQGGMGSGPAGTWTSPRALVFVTSCCSFLTCVRSPLAGHSTSVFSGEQPPAPLHTPPSVANRVPSGTTASLSAIGSWAEEPVHLNQGPGDHVFLLLRARELSRHTPGPATCQMPHALHSFGGTVLSVCK